MSDNTEALPPLPKLPPLTCGPETGHAAIHTPGQIHAYAIAYARAALAQQAATPTEPVKYVPVDSRLRDKDYRHPNDDEQCSPECREALNRRGDDEGQGLDAYWKWGFKAGWNARGAA